jgi:hypothetical protein
MFVYQRLGRIFRLNWLSLLLLNLMNRY